MSILYNNIIILIHSHIHASNINIKYQPTWPETNIKPLSHLKCTSATAGIQISNVHKYYIIYLSFSRDRNTTLPISPPPRPIAWIGSVGCTVAAQRPLKIKSDVNDAI